MQTDKDLRTAHVSIGERSRPVLMKDSGVCNGVPKAHISKVEAAYSFSFVQLQVL
jgi:hypothetical protein